MAMNKAEAQRLADLELGIQLARSMRWPEYNMPASMTRDEIEAAKTYKARNPGYRGDQMVARGWFANPHDGRVTYGCSDGIHHSSTCEYTTTQRMGVMYATEADAWRAVRYEMTQRFAKSLAAVDAKIAELLP